VLYAYSTDNCGDENFLQSKCRNRKCIKTGVLNIIGRQSDIKKIFLPGSIENTGIILLFCHSYPD
jgi:hypothetical protein